MRNFFILCAATALASAVSLTSQYENEHTELDVVGEDYDEYDMYDMSEEDADEHDDWATSLAQKSILRGFSRFTRKMRPIPTPRVRSNTGVDGGIDIGKPLRPRSFTGKGAVKRPRANGVDMGGSNRINRSASTGNLPSAKDIKITRPRSTSAQAPIRKLNKTTVGGGDQPGPLKLERSNALERPPVLNRQKGQFKPDVDGGMPAPGSLKLVRQNAIRPKANGLNVPDVDAPSFKRNRITGKPDTRKVNKTALGRFEKVMHAMTFVEISTTVAQMAQDQANHKEQLAAMDKQDKAYAAQAAEAKKADEEYQAAMIAAQAVAQEEYDAIDQQQADIDAATLALQEEADLLQQRIDDAAEKGVTDTTELQAEWNRIIAEQEQLTEDQQVTVENQQTLLDWQQDLIDAEVAFCTENPEADYCYS